MIFTVPMSGSEVVNSKTEIHRTNTAGEVSVRCYIYMYFHFYNIYIYAMSPLLNARVTLLR